MRRIFNFLIAIAKFLVYHKSNKTTGENELIAMCSVYSKHYVGDGNKYNAASYEKTVFYKYQNGKWRDLNNCNGYVHTRLTYRFTKDT